IVVFGTDERVVGVPLVEHCARLRAGFTELEHVNAVLEIAIGDGDDEIATVFGHRRRRHAGGMALHLVYESIALLRLAELVEADSGPARVIAISVGARRIETVVNARPISRPRHARELRAADAAIDILSVARAAEVPDLPVRAAVGDGVRDDFAVRAR